MDDEEQAGTSTPVTSAPSQSTSKISLPSLAQLITESPSVFSGGAGRHHSISSASQASYSPYFHSNQTSPAFGPQLSHVSSMPASAGPQRDSFGLGSPALKPLDSSHYPRYHADAAPAFSEQRRPTSTKHGRSEHELDREATAALLMLNHDRRDWRRSEQGPIGRNSTSTGMSVRDLLRG